jgi:hypothetical protein
LANLTQGCQIFLLIIYQSRDKIYQMTTKLTNAHKIYPLDSKILLMTIYCSILHSMVLQNKPKLGFFGPKRNHLATPISPTYMRINRVLCNRDSRYDFASGRFRERDVIYFANAILFICRSLRFISKHSPVINRRDCPH